MTALDRGQLWVMRLHGIAAALILLAAAGIAETVLRTAIELPRGIVTLPLLLPLVYVAFVSPGRRYRAWGYDMDGEELRVRRGVWTRTETLVPLARIQHIDVSQGPLERVFGVSRLILHTAGTLHSQVVVPGLARADAEGMRDAIRSRIGAEEA